MRSSPFSGIRNRVILLFLLVLVPIIVIFFFNFREIRRRSVEHTISYDAGRIINFAAIHEEAILRETQQILAMLASNPLVVKGGKQGNELLGSMLQSFPQYTNFGVARLNGEVYSSAIPLKTPVNISDRSYFRVAVEKRSFSGGQYQVGRITGKPAVNFGFPVLDKAGHVAAVVYAALDISRVTQFEYEVDAQTPKNSTYVKLDGKGSILSSYPSEQFFGRGNPLEKLIFERISKEKKGWFEAKGADGVERLYVFSNLHGALYSDGAYVVLGIPTEGIFAESNAMLARNLTILAVVVMVSLAIMWFGGTVLIVRPIRVLTDTSKRLAAGDLTARSGLPTTSDELGQLSRTFDDMAGELERKTEALHESNERFQNAFEHAAIGMALVAPDGHWLRVNRALCDLTGYSEGELLAKTYQDITHPDDLDADLAHVRQMLSGEIQTYQMEKRYFHKDGHVVWILLSASLVRDAEGNPVHFISQIQDITESKRTEENLRKAHQVETALRQIDEKIIAGANYREAMEIACDAVVEMGYRMCWGGTAEPDYSVRPVAVRGFEDGYLDTIRIRWDDSPEGSGPTGIAIRTGRPYVIEKIRTNSLYAPWREKAMERGYLSSAAFPMVSGEGEAIGVLHVYAEKEEAFDDEEISRLEMFARQCAIALLSVRQLEELRETTRRLAFHFHRMPLGYIAHDQECRIVGWNPAAERIFGWSAGEAIGKHPFELLVPPEAQAHVSGIWSKLREGDDSSGDSVGSAIRKDGTKVFCEFFSTPLRDATGAMTGLLTLVHDITEKARLERQLQTVQRMESVGTLAGGVAHDFNNALTGVIGFGELLRGKIAGIQGAIEDLDVMMQAAERASTLTRQLLTYARRLVIDPVNLGLNTLATDLMKLINKVVGEHIDVRTFLAKDLPTIHADRGQIEQVLMNLCLNARDAMPEGGQLLVETEEVYLDEEYVKHNPYIKAGRYALLKVSDTGIGMDEKTRERVFEPFFTTKGPEKGTGLGLAMVYGIVKQHDGYIHVYSEPGKGTTFKVYFPTVEDFPDAVVETRHEEAIRGGTETILLAEDEESVRRLAERALQELGYKVLVARNGEEAVEIFRRNEDIALAVLDVIMPRKGGKEAYEEMHKANPNLKVIFMSGYTANAIHESFVLVSGVPFLPKPFGPSALTRKVREVLDSQ